MVSNFFFWVVYEFQKLYLAFVTFKKFIINAFLDIYCTVVVVEFCCHDER